MKNLTVSIPEQAAPAEDPPSHVRVVSVLGAGRAATAELVDATWPDGREERCVEKVFAPGRLTRLLYRIAFAAPFAYQSNRHAIRACFYRRRVVAARLQQTRADVRVALPLYLRYCQRRGAWVLGSQWIEGRGPVIGRESGGEMARLISQMRDIENDLVDLGLYGTGWQVSPGAMVSTANLLVVETPSPTRTDGSQSCAKTAAIRSGNDCLKSVIIDLESGIPAVLLPRYLRLSWRNASLFPFDDLDAGRLAQAKERLPAWAHRDLKSLIHHSQQWKDSEVAIFRTPWNWLSGRRRRHYRTEAIRRWKLERRIDSASEQKLQASRGSWSLFWLLGLFPILGRRLQVFLGRERHRAQWRQLFTHPRFRLAVLRLLKARKVRQWQSEKRLPRAHMVSGAGFARHIVLANTLPARWHRWFADPRQRTLLWHRSQRMLLNRNYQTARARRTFQQIVRRWRSREWIDAEIAEKLLRDFEDPKVGIYARGLAKHLAIKAFSPLASIMKLSGFALTITGGSFWYSVLPFLLMPLGRSIITLQSWWVSRHQRTPHARAFFVGLIPTLGSMAFITQMYSSLPAISEFLLRDSASRIGQRLPIYGGADSRTEHALVHAMDAFIRILRPVMQSPGGQTFPIHDFDRAGSEDLPDKRYAA
ncbi:MAG: hypothetical protein AAGD07_09815 [Planctomycetota bacterium]